MKLYSVTSVFVAAGLFVISGFLWWSIMHDCPQAFQRCGALLILIGVIGAGMPYMRHRSIEEEAARRLPPVYGPYPSSNETENQRVKEREEARPKVIRAVFFERVIAFGFICVGTLINGFGDLPFNWLGYGS